MAQLIHRGLVLLLLLGGVFMVLAMIPLVLLILIGIGLFSITTQHTPRELTRRTALRAGGQQP